MIKTTTLRLPSETLIELKALAIRKGKSQNDIINEFINKGLKNSNKLKGKIKARKINHEMPGYDPEKKSNSKDIIGIVKLDHETDAVKLKNSIYTDKARF